MIQYMKSGRFFDMLFQIIQKIILKRNYLIASFTDQMMMVMPGISVQQMSDLIPHASIPEINPVHQLHIQ